jgi:FMN reductase
MSKVLLLSGSPSKQSRSNSILEYVVKSLNATGIETTLLGLRDFPAEDLVFAKYDSPAFEPLKASLEAAGAVVIATPIYKASLTGGLKALLDILPQNSFKKKTVLPIATGGTSAHLLAIDFAIKPILATLGASDIQQGVFIVDSQFTYKDDGGFTLEAELQERLDAGITQLAESVKAHIAR